MVRTAAPETLSSDRSCRASAARSNGYGVTVARRPMPAGQRQQVLTVGAGVRRDARQRPLPEEMALVVEPGDVAQVDAGHRQRAALVERRQRDRDQFARRGEHDRGVQPLRRFVVGRSGRGRSQLEGEPAGGRVPGEHVHLGALRERDLGGEVGARPESVDAQPAARRDLARRRARYPMMPAHSSGASWTSGTPGAAGTRRRRVRRRTRRIPRPRPSPCSATRGRGSPRRGGTSGRIRRSAAARRSRPGPH